MSENKYAHHVAREIVVMGKKGRPIVSTRHLEGFGNMSFECIYIPSPREMISQPHKHEFQQYLCFCSANPDDPYEFDAEVEISLGEEGEKQIIDKPAMVNVSAGLAHGPLNFVRVDKPILFVDMSITDKYERVGGTPD